MSIGKSALKRVENNGYSKLKTEAPDMQNSHVIAKVSQEVTEKMIAPVEEKTIKKTTKKTPTKTVACKKKSGFTSYLLGEDLPYYLL